MHRVMEDVEMTRLREKCSSVAEAEFMSTLLNWPGSVAGKLPAFHSLPVAVAEEVHTIDAAGWHRRQAAGVPSLAYPLRPEKVADLT